MFEAYSVAIKLSLINNVSSGLAAMSRQFSKTEADAAKLQGRLDSIKRLGLAGAAIGGAGFMGLGLLERAYKPAEAYAHQLNVINMAGWTQAEIMKAQAAAWRTTSQVITTSVTDNIANLLDLKNVLGTLPEAIHALPLVSKIQAVLAASADRNVGSNAKSLAYEVAKSVDMIGGAKNYDTFKREADMMAKVIIATGGRVTPEMYKQVFLYGRQASAGWSDSFKYQLLPTLMQEAASSHGGGGGSRGIGPATAAFFRTVVQGYINKKQMPLLEQLGLIKPGSALSTTTSGTTTGPMKNYQLAISNPYEWTQKVLMPAIHAKYGDVSRQQLTMILGQIFRGNQSAAWLVGQFATKPFNFERDAANIRRTLSIDQAYRSSVLGDPTTARRALSAQWANFQTALMMNVVPVVVPALMALTRGLNSMAMWSREHPDLSRDLVLVGGALAGLAAVGGSLMVVTAAVKGIALLAPSLGVAATGLASGAASLTAAVAPFLAMVYAVSQAVHAAKTGTSQPYNFVNWIGSKLSGNKSFALGSAIYNGQHAVADWFEHHNPFHHDVTVPHTGSRTTVVHTHVHVDGRKVAESVSKHTGEASSGPLAGMSWLNSELGLVPPNLQGDW